jgi:Leucine-rich repeat (LRR) protein
MRLQRSQRVWFPHGVFVILLILAAWGGTCWLSQEESRSASSPALFEALAEKQEQLEELSLPPDTTRLDWISDNIKRLSVAGTQIESLKGLPQSLIDLDARNTKVRSIEFAPKGLRSLDLRQNKIEHLVHLPPQLEVLKVGGERISRLGSLPQSLVSLHLEGTRIQDLTELPPDLKELYLQGRSFDNLDHLPGSLRVLTLDFTSVKSLKGLPPSLQTLELLNNKDMQFQPEDLPPLLTRLLVDEQSSPEVSGLQYLSWFSDRREFPRGSLPPFLSSLTIRVSYLRSLSDLPAFPASVRSLGLLNTGLSPLADLPLGLESQQPGVKSLKDLTPELEILTLTGYKQSEVNSLSKLRELKVLKLAQSSVSSIRDLPPGLKELDISGTGVLARDLKAVPRGLTTLIFCGARLKKLDGIADLFPSLQRLDVCDSSFLEEIGPLPETLKHLDLSGTRVSRLPELKGALDTLDISNTRINSLQELPESLRALRVLTIDEKQVGILAPMPSSVRILHVLNKL